MTANVWSRIQQLMKLVTALLLKNEENQYLVARRSVDQSIAGYWEFPGGKVEPNETIAECLIREIREELALEVIPGDEIVRVDYNYDHGQFQIIGIAAILSVSSSPQLQVHDQIRWLKLEDMHQVKLLPADVLLVEEILSNARYC